MKRKIFGAEIAEVAQPNNYLTWLYGGDPPPDIGFIPAWALALCSDGVTWGKLEDTGWIMGNNYYADLSPAVTMENILELRIFGQGGELLFWRSDAGLTGRALVDVGLPEEYFLSPFEEKQILLGTPQESINNSFTRVANSAGREQALPLVIAGDRPLKLEQPPFRLVIKHYFTQDDNGAVRVFVSRLVDLEVSIDGYA